MEEIELESVAPRRSRRVVFAAAAALVAVAAVSVPLLHSDKPDAKVVQRDTARKSYSAPASQDDTIDPVDDAPVATGDSTTSTTMRSSSTPITTVTTTQPGAPNLPPDDPDAFDPGPPVAPDPRFLQFALPNKRSYPQFLTAGPDGSMWFAEENTPAIGRITLDGDITEFPLQGFSTPCDITVGPDGALWFTDANSSLIGRITTTGVVSSFDVGLRGGYSVVSGPDNALWFVANSNAVGRLTTGGSITIFDDIGVQLRAITSGPDGNLWITDLGGALWRVTPSGVATKVLVTALADKYVFNLAFGPDGELWVSWTTQYGESGLTRRTSDGHVDTFALTEWADELVVRPNGDVWFAAGGANRMGKITPQGKVTTFAIKRVAGLAIGPDGYIWFANDLGSAIGRIRPVDA